MIVLICGSRGWHDPAPIREALLLLRHAARQQGDTLTLVHGAASTGADFLANRLAEELDIEVKREPANWKELGKRAGPVRNQLMLDKYRVDTVLAFRAEGKSNGTDDMIDKADRAGISYQVITRADEFDLTKALPSVS